MCTAPEMNMFVAYLRGICGHMSVACNMGVA